MRVTKPTKRILEIAQMLGPDYAVKNIDFENVIYRKINGYEFEVSGLDRNSKTFNATLYVWDVTLGIFTVESVPNIRTMNQLRSILAEKAHHYQTREHVLPEI